MTTEQIAKICHEAVAAYSKSLGDSKAIPSWDKATEEEKEAVTKSVILHIGSVDAYPAENHNAWVKERVDSGWVFGEVEDEKKKTHPFILPFDQLPIEQQIKEHLLRGIVQSMIPFVKN
jgi:hypothetical protein